jgi:thioredoxin 1
MSKKHSTAILFLFLALFSSCTRQEDIPANADYGKGQDIQVVKFYADWCPPCQAMNPEYEKMKQLYPYVKFYEVDWDKNKEKAEKFDIKSIPYVIKITNRSKVKRNMGYMSRNDLVRFIESE